MSVIKDRKDDVGDLSVRDPWPDGAPVLEVEDRSEIDKRMLELVGEENLHRGVVMVTNCEFKCWLIGAKRRERGCVVCHGDVWLAASGQAALAQDPERLIVCTSCIGRDLIRRTYGQQIDRHMAEKFNEETLRQMRRSADSERLKALIEALTAKPK